MTDLWKVLPKMPIFGYHTEGLFNFSSNVITDEQLALIQDLNPRLLRFPGGTPSSYFRYEVGPPARLWRADLGQEILLDEVIRVFAILGADIILSANVWTGTEAETVDLITYLKAGGLNIVGVELGNEMYFVGTYYPNVGAYITVAESFDTAIKAAHRGMRTAICASPLTGQHNTADNFYTPLNAGYTTWNTGIAAEDFYDAINVHQYIGLDTPKGLPTELEQYQGIIEEARSYEDEAADATWAAYDSTFTDLPEIWITEYNFNDPGTYGNTMAQAIYLARTLMIYHYLGQGALKDRLKYSTVHNLGAASGSYNRAYRLVDPRAVGEPALVDVGSGYVRTCGYFVFKMLEELRDFGLTFRGGLTALTCTPGRVDCYTFLDSDKHAYLFIINDSGVSQTITEIDVGGNVVTVDSYKVLYGPELRSSRGWRSGGSYDSLAVWDEDYSGAIPAYSVGIITVNLP